MSQQMVGIVIDRLLDDEELRVRFVRDRIETLGALSFLGIALTRAELDVFLQSDSRLWFWDRGVVGIRTH